MSQHTLRRPASSRVLYRVEPHPRAAQNPNVRHRHEQEQQQNIHARLAVFITRTFGTIYAFYVLVAWMLLWMLLASLGVGWFAADHYPFPFLLFLSNLVQLWALPVLAFGNAVLSRKQELHAEETYELAVKIAHELNQIHRHENAQDEQMLMLEDLVRQLAQHLASGEQTLSWTSQGME